MNIYNYINNITKQKNMNNELFNHIDKQMDIINEAIYKPKKSTAELDKIIEIIEEEMFCTTEKEMMEIIDKNTRSLNENDKDYVSQVVTAIWEDGMEYAEQCYKEQMNYYESTRGI